MKAHITSVCFKCFRCFRGMLQLLHIDIAKVDRDVGYFCNCIQCYVASVLQQVFNLDVAYVSHTCYKCFICMLHMFHTHVASVLS